MYSDWQAAAQKAIAALDRQFTDADDWRARQKVLRAAANGFHGGTSWGRRTWAKHSRKYLEMHGKPPRTPPTEAVPMFASDIIFPFREN